MKSWKFILLTVILASSACASGDDGDDDDNPANPDTRQDTSGIDAPRPPDSLLPDTRLPDAPSFDAPMLPDGIDFDGFSFDGGFGMCMSNGECPAADDCCLIFDPSVGGFCVPGEEDPVLGCIPDFGG